MTESEQVILTLEKQVSVQTKRIAALEAFVGDVLKLSRFPWLHPHLAPDKEFAKVTKLMAKGWELLPSQEEKPPPTNQLDEI